jgi:hypothetical protein
MNSNEKTPEYWLGYLIGNIDAILSKNISEFEKNKEIEEIIQSFKDAIK